MKKSGALTAALVLAGGASHADAATITMPLNASVNGTAQTFSFNLASYLSNAGGNFALQSATVDVQGYSPQQTSYSYVSGGYYYVSGYSQQYAGYYYTVQTGGYYTSYSCGWAGWNTCTDFHPTYTTYPAYYSAPVYAYATTYTAADGTKDTLLVSTGEGSGQTSDTNMNGASSSGDYYGSLDASATLTTADLLAADQSGLINFTVNSQGNPINLSQASLSFTLTAVPEPMTWAMMAVGFGVVGQTIRRDRRRKRVRVA